MHKKMVWNVDISHNSYEKVITIQELYYIEMFLFFEN